MQCELSAQIDELQEVHKSLIDIKKTDNGTIVSGSLPFQASVDGYEVITDDFDIVIIVPDSFPKLLPTVKEKNRKIDSNYEHINEDGTLCLAVPIEERRLFLEQPSLLGFVNKLLIPFFYSYCYWKKYHKYPFGESMHGDEGIVQYYIDELRLINEASVLKVVSFLFEYGYRGHHPCPCGSGKILRNCHSEQIRKLNEWHTEDTLKRDLKSVITFFISKSEKDNKAIPVNIKKLISRILIKIKSF